MKRNSPTRNADPKLGGLTLVSSIDKFSVRLDKRSKIDYQLLKEGEKIKIEIKKTIIGETIQLVSASFEEKEALGFPYSKYQNWFWA